MPDIAVATVLLDAVDNGFDGIDLIWAHDHELLLTRYQHHVAVDCLAQRTFDEEGLGEAV
ncbi:hypothetical protein D3C73_803360 [compost metagenome]